MTVARAIAIANLVSQTSPPTTPVADPATAKGLNSNANQSQQLAQAIIELASAVSGAGSVAQSKGLRFGDSFSVFPVVSGTAVETIADSVLIPANSLEVGSVVQCIHSGTLTNGTGSDRTVTIRVNVDGIIYSFRVITITAGSSVPFTAYTNMSIVSTTAATQTNPIIIVSTGIVSHDPQTGTFTFEILTDSNITISFEWEIADPALEAKLTNRQIVAFP